IHVRKGHGLMKHTRKILPHSLRQKFFIANLLIVAGAFLLFGVFLTYLLYRNAVRQNMTVNETAFHNMEYFITEKTMEIKHAVNTVALDAHVTAILSQPDDPESAAAWYTDYSTLQEICLTNTAVSCLQDLTIISDSNFASHFHSERLLPFVALTDTAWAGRLALFKGNCFFQKADLPETLQLQSASYTAVTCPYPFHYDQRTTYFLGYLDDTVFGDLLLPNAGTPYTSYFLCNTMGEILAERAGDFGEALLSLLQASDLSDRLSVRKRIDGRTYYVDSAPINNTNLILIGVQEYDRMAVGILKQNIGAMLLILLITLPFVAATSYIITRSLTRRLHTLKEHMLQVSSGNFNMDILSVTDMDEVSLLNQHFNYMATRIALLLDEKIAIGKQLKEQELIALQAQINPHFLYNTLDLIKWQAVRHHDSDIEALVSSLSDYYRLALSKGREYLPLRSELTHIEAYVYIQNQRFDGHIQLEFQVPEDCMDYLLPKLTLQPLVENAILHGILETDEEEGRITICCHTEAHNLHLTVADDGVGMEPETVSSLFTKIPGETVLSSGYGLYNIRERIRLTYGEQCEIRIQSAPGQGTSVTLILPDACPL
ncbi:MAG: histidine kinase, partial [Lachnospiraceae bacterium]|nr:histidine kinase [Lachnospiraceae bacterium]